jgi:hypothetical protein
MAEREGGGLGVEGKVEGVAGAFRREAEPSFSWYLREKSEGACI